MTRLIRIKTAAVVSVAQEFLASGRVRTDWKDVGEEINVEIDLKLIKQLEQHAVENYDSNGVDAWFAPRLHCALRIPRRVASDRYMWTWLALECHKYVGHRFPGTPTPRWRFTDEGRTPLLRNAMSRLWWGAEMCRNGKSYQDVVTAFARTRTAEFALELMYSWNRPAAIAFARVAEGKDGGDRLKDEVMSALSSRLRIYLSLRALEAAHLDHVEDTEEHDLKWAEHAPALAELLTTDRELEGPRTGEASTSAIDELVHWIRQVADEIVAERVETATLTL